MGRYFEHPEVGDRVGEVNAGVLDELDTGGFGQTGCNAGEEGGKMEGVGAVEDG